MKRGTQASALGQPGDGDGGKVERKVWGSGGEDMCIPAADSH